MSVKTSYKLCVEPGCQLVKHPKRSRCLDHFNAAQRASRAALAERQQANRVPCIEDDCEHLRHGAKTRCLKHYRHYRRVYLRARQAERVAARSPRVRNSDRQCLYCTRPVHAKDLCHSHYKDYAKRKPCAISGCRYGMHAQGFCFRHYSTYYDAKMLEVIQPQGRLSPAERFARYVYVTPSCHLWTGSISGGRGHFTVSEQAAPAHRVAFECERGPIPTDDEDKSLQLDHGCRIQLCVRVDHLEPVTAAENMRRQNVAHGRDHITQADGWLFGLAIPAWQRGADNFPASVVKTA